MNKRTFTKEEVFQGTEENEAKHLASKPHKHSMSVEIWVIPADGKFWKIDFLRDYNEGWMLDEETDGVEVKLVEKTVIVKEWEEV